MSKLKVTTLFSGIGAQEAGLKRLGVDFEMVGMCEIDKYAIKSYEGINGPTHNYGDISKIDRLDYTDLLVYSSPCFPRGSMVLTDGGYKDIADIQVGDKVLTHLGNWKTVVRVGGRRVPEVYTMRAQGILDITASKNHPFFIRYKKKRWDNKTRKYEYYLDEPQKVKMEDIKPNGYIGVNILQTEKNPLNLTPELCYFFGRFIADGHYSDNHGKEIAIVIGKEKALEFEEHIKSLKYSKYPQQSCYRYVFRDERLCKLLLLLGLNKYAYEKEIGYDLLCLPVNLLSSVIDGYMNGDGCLIKNYYQATTTSKKLALSLVIALQKVYKRGCRIYYTKRPDTHIIEGRTVNQRDTYMVRMMLNDTKHAYYVLGNIIWYPIKNITSTQKTEEVFNIEVEEEHTYTCNNAIVFNCQDFSLAGKQAGIIGEDGKQTRSGLLLEVGRLLMKMSDEKILPKYLLMENVKNLVGKKFKPAFDIWLKALEAIGYNNYWKVLNSKDYGVPQNRERVFVVSIRKDVDTHGYTFPEPFKLNRRLKDVLETNVDEKYYLKQELVETFIKRLAKREASNTIQCGGAGSIDQKHTRDLVAEPSIVQNHHGYNNGGIIKDNVTPTMTSNGSYHLNNFVINEPIIGRSIGRNPDNPLSRVAGLPTEQMLEINHSGCSNTLTTVGKDNLVVEPINACADGTAPALTAHLHKETVNDCTKLDRHSPALGVIEIGIGHNPISKKFEFDGFHENKPCPTLLATDYKCPKCYSDGVRIRKLTPKECWRLMDFTDEEFEAAEQAGVSKTQLYKQAGNSIVVSCLAHIFRELLKGTEYEPEEGFKTDWLEKLKS